MPRALKGASRQSVVCLSEMIFRGFGPMKPGFVCGAWDGDEFIAEDAEAPIEDVERR